MVFEVGETVVYPHHGAATIEEIKTRTVKGCLLYTSDAADDLLTV